MASDTFQQVFRLLLSDHVESIEVLVDIGSKDGIIASHLGRVLNCTAVSVDIEYENTSRTSHCTFIQADGNRLPLSDNSVDAVVSNMVLEHIPDERRMIEEVSRVLRSNGIFIVIFPNRVWPLDGHGFPPGTVWLPRWAGKRLTSLFAVKHGYYRRSMYPTSAYAVKRSLDRHFDEVKYKSDTLLDVEYDDSRRGELLRKAERPLTTALRTPVFRKGVELLFPTSIYVARNLAHR